MSDPIDVDPTKDNMGAAGGASGGDDENPQDYNVTGAPTEAYTQNHVCGTASPADPFRSDIQCNASGANRHSHCVQP